MRITAWSVSRVPAGRPPWPHVRPSLPPGLLSYGRSRPRATIAPTRRPQTASSLHTERRWTQTFWGTCYRGLRLEEPPSRVGATYQPPGLEKERVHRCRVTLLPRAGLIPHQSIQCCNAVCSPNGRNSPSPATLSPRIPCGGGLKERVRRAILGGHAPRHSLLGQPERSCSRLRPRDMAMSAPLLRESLVVPVYSKQRKSLTLSPLALAIE